MKCFQVTCCHIALGSQITLSGNVLKEMGRARLPKNRKVTHARKLSLPRQLFKHTAQSGPGGGRAPQRTVHWPVVESVGFSLGLLRSLLVWPGEKLLLKRKASSAGWGEKSPSRMAANPETRVSNCIPATINESVSGLGWGSGPVPCFKIMRY